MRTCVHFLTDVLMGAAVGAAVGSAVPYFHREPGSDTPT